MKKLLKPFLKYYLKYATKLAIAIHRPTIIVVAGSVNKAFVSQEIENALKKYSLNTRISPKNFNTEFGLPLSVLGLPSGYNSFRGWWPAIKQTPKKIFSKNFPKYLVLSLGASDPGDIKYLLSIIRPKIAVVTDITQRYLEGFASMEKLVSEYQYLAEQLPLDGLLILNYDNYRIKDIKANCPIVSFGLQAEADWQAQEITKTDRGQIAKIKHSNQITTQEISRFGLHHIQSLIIGLIVENYVTDKK